MGDRVYRQIIDSNGDHIYRSKELMADALIKIRLTRLLMELSIETIQQCGTTPDVTRDRRVLLP